MDINIFIFRRDFRIHDNLALNSLIKDCGNKGIYPIFIFNPAQIYPKNNSLDSDDVKLAENSDCLQELYNKNNNLNGNRILVY